MLPYIIIGIVSSLSLLAAWTALGTCFYTEIDGSEIKTRWKRYLANFFGGPAVWTCFLLDFVCNEGKNWFHKQ
jgi:hypothetical protein